MVVSGKTGFSKLLLQRARCTTLKRYSVCSSNGSKNEKLLLDKIHDLHYCQCSLLNQ